MLPPPFKARHFIGKEVFQQQEPRKFPAAHEMIFVNSFLRLQNRRFVARFLVVREYHTTYITHKTHLSELNSVIPNYIFRELISEMQN